MREDTGAARSVGADPGSDPSACFHCALPVLAPGRFRATLFGASREFCCAGCAAVASTIAEAGFADYYARRTAPAVRAGGGASPVSERAALYDDSDAQQAFGVIVDDGAREVTLILDRIRCSACLWLNEQWLRRQPGVLAVHLNYTTHRAQLRWDPSRTQLSTLVEAIRAIGYEAYPFEPGRQQAIERRDRRASLLRLFVAGFGAMQVMMYAFPAYLDGGAGGLSAQTEHLMRWASLVLTLPVILISCTPFFSGAWQSLRQGRVSLDAPIALGIAVGFGASVWATLTRSGAVYFDTITMLAFALLAARHLETMARHKAGRSLDHLARWQPEFALRFAADAALPERVAAHALRFGDRVLVPPGERVPADGVVCEGESSVDEALLTGESRPQRKRAGSALIGGSVNYEQPLVFEVRRTGSETRAAQLLRLVERAAAAKPRLVESADRIAAWMTAVVLAVAALAFVAWLPVAPAQAAWVAVAVLVATCPCALALAAPIVLTRTHVQLLERGLVMTRGRAIETLARATDVVLDKTGTLTQGHLSIVGFVSLGVIGDSAARTLAGALEASSRHPVARAFACAEAPSATEVRHATGQGVEGVIAGERLRIGCAAYCAALTGSPPPEIPERGATRATPVYLASRTRGWLGLFLLEDAPRNEARALVQLLQARGLRLHLLSGDAPAVVQALAAQLGIEDWRARATPQDKFDAVGALQRGGATVVMLGDGVNDAPVLAGADVSIALAAGADLAQSQSDLVLLGDRTGVDLRAVDAALDVAHRALRVIRQNFGWALSYNAVALPAAALGWIGPWEAAIGMTASSFIVVFNALRPLGPAVATKPHRAPGAHRAAASSLET